MPGNWGYLSTEIKEYLCENYDDSCSILDIGCGHGFYYKLLNHHFKKFDAVEIWEPYIKEYDLEKMYDNVFNINILDFDFDHYDIIIMGDILEHLSREDGIKLLHKLKDKCNELIVVVPYYLPQNEVFGNKYEIHLQPDLDDEIMSTFYPMLELIEYKNFNYKKRIDVGDKTYYYCAFKKKKQL
jgi:SAM-dependent methyltransferase